jgi:hypothetical protein
MVAGLAMPSPAAANQLPEPVSATGTADTFDPGTLIPLGNAKFATQDRVYSGRSIGRAHSDVWETCLTGVLNSVENWVLEAPRMAGTHAATVTIRSERGSLVLRLRGLMEYPNASGTWTIQRATGSCPSLGEGRYTATYAVVNPELRLALEGAFRTP